MSPRPSESSEPEPLTVRVRRDGSLECLHNEALGLEALGSVEVRRASHVEFDEGDQVWYVEDADTGERLHEHARRERCLAWERRHFNRALRRGLRPFVDT